MEENIRDGFLNENVEQEEDNTPIRRLLPSCQVIGKILCEGRMDVIEQFGLNEEHIYDPQYKDLYMFIKQHYAKYGSVPDYETLLSQDRFHSIIDTITPRVSEPDAFLRDQLWEDYMFHKTAAVLQKAASLTEDNPQIGVEYLNSQMALLNQEIKPGGTDIIQEAQERLEAYNKRRSTDNYYIPTGFPQLDDKICGWAPGEELVVLVARTGVGKEQPLYSKVLTPSGWKTMGNIHAGDAVISGTGRYTTVLEVFPQGVKPVYRLFFTDGTFVDAGLEHLWTVQSRFDRLTNSDKGTYQVVTTQYLIDHIQDDWTVDVAPAITFSGSFSLPVDPYLLGVILSDNTICTHNSIILPLHNKTIVEQVRRRLKLYNCKLARYNKSRNLYEIKPSSFRKRNLLLEGLLETENLHVNSILRFIPEIYRRASIAQRMQLLVGMIDNIGSISESSMFTFKVTSATLSDNLSELIGSLNMWHTVRRINTSELVFDKFTVKSRVNLQNVPELLENWRPPRSFKRHIKSIEYFRDYECQCIMVDDPTHTYITDNYTITHNTWVMTKMLTEAWRNNLNVGLLEPEMTGVKIGYRFDAIFKGFSNRKLSYARDLEGDYDRYANYIEDLKRHNTKFCVSHPKDFGGTVTVSKIKQWCISNDIKILGIDGISYMKDERGKPSDNTTTALTNISADLMELSIELGIPVIIVVQSNRGSMETGGKPTLETIRDSDGIAYSASQVYSIYVKHDALHLALLKNRNGESNVTLAYDWDIDVGKFEFLQEGEVQGDDDEEVSNGSTHSYSNNSHNYRQQESSQRPDRSSGYTPAGMNADQVDVYERREVTGADVF